MREKIKNNLPVNVFQTISDPFYSSEHNLFYLENTSYVFPDNAYFAGEEHNSFQISIINQSSQKKTPIYRYQARPAYDMSYSLHHVSLFDDPYFCDENSSVLFLSLALSFCGKYPTSWPDFDVILIITISRIESSSPRVTLVDYKCVGAFSKQEQAFINNIILEIEQSFLNNK